MVGFLKSLVASYKWFFLPMILPRRYYYYYITGIVTPRRIAEASIGLFGAWAFLFAWQEGSKFIGIVCWNLFSFVKETCIKNFDVFGILYFFALSAVIIIISMAVLCIILGPFVVARQISMSEFVRRVFILSSVLWIGFATPSLVILALAEGFEVEPAIFFDSDRPAGIISATVLLVIYMNLLKVYYLFTHRLPKMRNFPVLRYSLSVLFIISAFGTFSLKTTKDGNISSTEQDVRSEYQAVE